MHRDLPRAHDVGIGWRQQPRKHARRPRLGRRRSQPLRQRCVAEQIEVARVGMHIEVECCGRRNVGERRPVAAQARKRLRIHLPRRIGALHRVDHARVPHDERRKGRDQ